MSGLKFRESSYQYMFVISFLVLVLSLYGIIIFSENGNLIGHNLVLNILFVVLIVSVPGMVAFFNHRLKKEIFEPLNNIIGTIDLRNAVEGDVKELTSVKDKLENIIASKLRKSSAPKNAFFKKHILPEKSIEEYYRLLDFCPVPMAITDFKTGEFIYFNEHFEKWTGYRKNEMLGAKTTEFEFYVNPSDRKYIVKELKSKGKA